MRILRSLQTLRVMTGLGLVLYIAIPLLAYAQGVPKQIVPCAGALADGSLPACTPCHIAELAQNIINIGIILSVFVAAILFSYAGFLYVTSATFQKHQQAQKLFLNVVIGLVVILGAWIAVDTIMKTFVGSGSGSFGPWNDVCRNLPLSR